jgi:hypothetical protein
LAVSDHGCPGVHWFEAAVRSITDKAPIRGFQGGEAWHPKTDFATS